MIIVGSLLRIDPPGTDAMKIVPEGKGYFLVLKTSGKVISKPFIQVKLI